MYAPMTTSPAAPVSSAGNWPTRKSCAYQSLQPSPIAPACAVFSAPMPSASDDQPVREPVRVLVVEHRRVAAAGDVRNGERHRYICMIGDSPRAA